MVDYLDPDIANEGVSAEAWSPALEPPRIPTPEMFRNAIATAADKTKRPLKDYFPQLSGRPYKHQAFPCWLYHPKEGAREIKDVYGPDEEGKMVIVKKASQVAKEFGV